MKLYPNHADLYLKARLLVSGVDFSFKGVIDALIEQKKVRSGTGLYNYHRSKENQDSSSKLSALNVLGHSNIKCPNEILFPNYSYPFRVEVRSNPDSPFKVLMNGQTFRLFDETNKIELSQVDFPVQLPFNFKISPYGNAYGAVVHPMGENALRIYPDMTCLMDKPGIKCRFCGTLPQRRLNAHTGEALTDDMIVEEIITSVEAAQDEMPVDHVFMSTGAFYSIRETEFYARVIQGIKNTLKNKHSEILFALTPPPENRVSQLDLLIDAGVTDLSFNLEVWDPRRWDLNNTDFHLGEFKVRRGQKDHFAAFNHTVKRLGWGCAKSNFVGGLESLETLFVGFETVLECGVIPSMTVYYPAPGAEWIEAGIDPTDESFRADPASYLVGGYIGLAERILKAGLKPHWAPENRISALEWDAFSYLLKDPSIGSRVKDRMRQSLEASLVDCNTPTVNNMFSKVEFNK